MKIIKFGIAGFGKMGKIRLESILRSDEAEIIAIFDINNNDDFDNNIIFCKSYDDLLKTDIEAVFISTYVNFAAEYVTLALEAEKHVFCEKPPSINSNQMLKIIKIEKKNDKIIKYGFNHRFHQSVIKAKKIIDEGKLGKLLWMRGFYGKAGSIDFKDNWRNYKKYSGGGILLDQGIHMLDLFRYFSNDEFTCLNSHIETLFWKIECEDNAFVTLKSNGGVVATLHSSATHWKHKFLLEMTFENGYINLDGILSSTNSYAPEMLIVGYRQLENLHINMGKPKESTFLFEKDHSFDLELNEFINAIKGKESIINGTTNDALEIMKITDHIYNK